MSRLDPKEPLMGHLRELFSRLKRSLVFVMAGFGVGYWISEDVLQWIMVPIKAYLPPGVKLVYTQPFEQVFVLMKMSVILGMGVALPLVFSQFYFFLRRGLKPHESWRLWTTFAGSLGLAFLGVIWSYHYLLPLILSMVLGYQNLDLSPVISLSYYVNASLGLLLVGALFFEVPYFMILSSAWGWVPAKKWSQCRRYALVVNALVSAILSPPDVASMLVMMVPLQLLYEIGHWGARFFGSRRVKREPVVENE